MPIPKPKTGESPKDFVKRCMIDSTMVKEYNDNDQRYAVCRSQIEAKLEGYNDYPEQASENAKTALRWAEENGWGDCGGINWAQRKLKQLENE